MSAELQQEIATKIDRVVRLLNTENRRALLIRRNENLSWITAGRLSRRVLLPSDTNVASILITQDGGRFYFTTNNEAPRLADEDMEGLGFEPIFVPWHAAGFDQELRYTLGDGSLVSDSPYGTTAVIDLVPLRTPLLDTEIARYRALGQEVADIVAQLLLRLTPGMNEHQMNALVASTLWAVGIEPSVLLMAVDERIMKYKHAVGYGQTLLNFGMLNLCARRAGLCISITRFVYFGPMPQQLKDAFGIAAQVNAALLAGTRVGATAEELYHVAQRAYTQAGFAGEEQLHHQGGATGYGERDWLASPFGRQKVVDRQAVAWNPSIRGGKVEDTVLLKDGKIELLTATPTLPQVMTKVGEAEYVSAGVLQR